MFELALYLKRHIYVSLISSIIYLLIIGCQQSTNDELERALVIAGENRSELELVLRYFENDRLKLDAAKFLISNMPGHYSYVDSDLMEKYYDRVKECIINNLMGDRKAIADSINLIASRLDIKNSRIVEDIKIIKSDFLIKNIEDAFSQWQSGSWAKHLTFDQFCEYLLPYKVDELQPLDDWRTKFRTFKSDSIYELDYCDMYKNSSYRAAIILNKNLGSKIKPFSWNVLDCRIFDIATLCEMPFGGCDDYAMLTAALFRSAGLPVSIEFVPHWAYRSLGHKGNAVLASNGKSLPFSGMSSGPEFTHHIDEKMAKVYRITYSHNKEIVELKQSNQFVPDVFRNEFMRDVTDEYVATLNLSLEISNTDNHYVFLAIYGDNDWFPVDFSRIINNRITFKNIGKI